MRSSRVLLGMLAVGFAAASSTGCVSYFLHMVNVCHLTFPWNVPVLVPQVIGDSIQEHMEKDYRDVPILPPVRDYAPVYCMDPPSEYDIVRAMKKPTRGGKIPFMYEKHNNKMRFDVQKIVDHIDECRFYPLVGPAQLHHCHYRVTIYYNEMQRSYYPFAWEVSRPSVDVVYIDKDHLHICTSPEMEELPESYKDIYGAY